MNLLVVQWPLKFHPWYGLNLPTLSIIKHEYKFSFSWPGSPVLGIICPNVGQGFFTNHPATPFHPAQTYGTTICHSETCLGNISPKSCLYSWFWHLFTGTLWMPVNFGRLFLLWAYRPCGWAIGSMWGVCGAGLVPLVWIFQWFQLWFAGPLWWHLFEVQGVNLFVFGLVRSCWELAISNISSTIIPLVVFWETTNIPRLFLDRCVFGCEFVTLGKV